MSSITALEILSKPLILTEIEETQVCLGHRNLMCEYKTRAKAKIDGLKWLEEKNSDLTIKNSYFKIEERSKKRNLLFCYFTHVNNVNTCDHYQIKVIRKTYNSIFNEVLGEQAS